MGTNVPYISTVLVRYRGDIALCPAGMIGRRGRYAYEYEDYV